MSPWLWAQNQSLIRNLKGHVAAISAVAFSTEGDYVASGAGTSGGKSELIVWKTKTGEEVYKFVEYDRKLNALAFSPDGKYLLSAEGNARNGYILQREMSTGKEVTRYHHLGVLAMDFSRDGTVLCSAGIDKNIKVWNMRSRSARVLQGHQEVIMDVAVSGDGRYAVSAGGSYAAQKGEIIVWDLTAKKMLHPIGHQGKGHGHAINSVDISPDGKYIVSGGEDGSLKLWETQTGRLEKDLSEPYAKGITQVVFSPDGRFIAGSSRDNTVKLWDVATGEKITSFRGHFKEVLDVAFSADGRYLLSGGIDKTLKIWRAMPYKRMIELYVQPKIKEWQKKGKYEKTEEYQARVNQNARAQQAQKYVQEAINEIAGIQVKFTVLRSDYDADNEVFRITFKDIPPVYLKVGIDEAAKFDANLNQGQIDFQETNFTLSNKDEIVLLQAQLKDRQTQQTYTYDSQEHVAFNHRQLNIEYDPIEIDAPNYANTQVNKNKTDPRFIRGSEVDYQLPVTQMKKPDAVAVVIGNSTYQKTKSVDFAVRDARSMRNYLMDVMGFQKENIIYLENASYADFKMVFGSKGNPKGKLYNLVKAGKSDVFVFYSGHGAPGLNDKQAYFVTTECDPQYVELTGFPTGIFYDNLAKLPAKSVVVTLDACFSGENIYENISPIIIKSKGALGLKNGALLASSQADQVSTWYNEKGHGMFTYFFLKAIHNKNGDADKNNQLTLQEIFNYINDQTEGIPYYARRLHGIQQNPVLKGQNPYKVLVDYK